MKNVDFKYYDPHEAPCLTFGVEDIITISKNSNLNSNSVNKKLLINEKSPIINSNSYNLPDKL